MNELKDTMVQCHFSLPRFVRDWIEQVAKAERRKPGDVVRLKLIDCYEAENPAPKANGADKHANGKRA